MTEMRVEDNTGTMVVQESHQFDVQPLQRYMEDNVAGFAGKLSVEQFKGGSRIQPTCFQQGIASM